MASLVPPSSRSISQMRKEERLWIDKIFPAHIKIAWRSILGIWALYLTYKLLLAVTVGSVQVSEVFTPFTAMTLVSIVATWLLYRIMLVLGDTNAIRFVVFLITLPTIMLVLALVQLDHWLSSNGLFFSDHYPGLGSTIEFRNGLIPYLLLVAWGAIYLAITQYAEKKIAIENSRKYQKLKLESEQLALRFQLNPHFVFNALNSVSSLVIESKNDQAEKLIDELADYMREVLDDDGQDMVSVSSEIAQQVRYLDIERVRFPERLRYEINVSEEVENWKIPTLIVQPLIENAIKHGVARSSAAVRITVDANEANGRLELSVRNSGRISVIDSNRGTGTGLKNIEERLFAAYGPSAALITGNENDGMAVATIIIPAEPIVAGIGVN